MIRTTLATVALIVAAGVAHAQMQAPSTPEGRDQRSMPGATSNPNTAQPKSPMNPSAAEAAAKAELEKKGYTGVKSPTRDPAATGPPRRCATTSKSPILEPMVTLGSRAQKALLLGLAGRFTPRRVPPALPFHTSVWTCGCRMTIIRPCAQSSLPRIVTLATPALAQYAPGRSAMVVACRRPCRPAPCHPPSLPALPSRRRRRLRPMAAAIPTRSAVARPDQPGYA
jgi:hypothetical protein